MISLVNPYTQSSFQELPFHTPQEITNRLFMSIEAQSQWRKCSLEGRSALLENLALVLEKNIQEWSQAIAISMGKPVTQAASEVSKSADLCRYYAQHIGKMLTKKHFDDFSKAHVRVSLEPCGGVLGIMPWNFPLWQVIRFAVPALAGGNTVLLKHAPNVSNCALLLEQNIQEAGFPKGVFQCLLLPNEGVESVIASYAVSVVAFTGSEAVGRIVASMAGKYLKKSILELGGSDPFVVCADANLLLAAQTLALSRCQNAGQSCVAAKRLIVEQSVHDEFIHLLKKEFQKFILGDPISPNTSLGPLARADLATKLEEQLQKSQALGAECVLTGLKSGWGFTPSLWTNIKKGMPLYDEEIFGPALAILTFKTDEEALFLANDTVYGLGATVFGSDSKRLDYFLDGIRAGGVYANTLMRSDKRLPFGGVKQSGYGRELGQYGLHEFLCSKTCWSEY